MDIPFSTSKTDNLINCKSFSKKPPSRAAALQAPKVVTDRELYETLFGKLQLKIKEVEQVLRTKLRRIEESEKSGIKNLVVKIEMQKTEKCGEIKNLQLKRRNKTMILRNPQLYVKNEIWEVLTINLEEFLVVLSEVQAGWLGQVNCTHQKYNNFLSQT
ncbi:MAG: hypothetical protein EOM55_05520 [Clostridia bacterium]|nr:hypothetical protein [Clostridia bacterium]